MFLRLCFFVCPFAALVSAASIPRSDEGVVLFNDKNGWDGGLQNLGRGSRGAGGAMMWSGWGPGGMTAFTSTGGDLLPPPGPEDQPEEGRGLTEGSDIKGEERSPGNPLQPPSNGNGANANASFNAWFPIVLGMIPGGQQGEGGRGGGWPPVAAIANSISHGTRGVATSHAVAYGGGPPGQQHNGYGHQQLTPQQQPHQQQQQRRRH